MAETAGRIGMAAVRVGAVVLALGAMVFIVVNAQRNASLGDSAPTPGEATPAEGAPLELPPFLPSSKSEAIVFEAPKPVPSPEKESAHFLRSSKSLSFDSGTAPAAPKKKPTKPRKPVFLPSSKSMPIEPPVVKNDD